MQFGPRKGYQPNRHFIPLNYLRFHPEALAQNINPLLHYIQNFRQAAALASQTDIDFDQIYHCGGFGGNESCSGTGSSLQQTEKLRTELQKIFFKYSIKSVLDIPCGDCHWISSMDFTDIAYTGGDIVADLIEKNKIKFGRKFSFLLLDLCRGPLPAADMLLTRDCFVHLSFEEIAKALTTIRNSDIHYFSATTFTSCTENYDLDQNTRWRPLNLCLPPFNFPAPTDLINENCTENAGQYQDKCLAIWEIARL
ncbi:MAG: class I SAM-dependent methyltransferase [Desulfovibrio sp.]|uniref:class I SAM-dependent methyltransferase n=1 Tax=Desulfovibrio sp. TaxID=885 RepID=UPI0039E6BE89